MGREKRNEKRDRKGVKESQKLYFEKIKHNFSGLVIVLYPGLLYRVPIVAIVASQLRG